MRRNWLIWAIALGVVAIVVAALVMRLTEDEPPSTQEWAEEVCTSLSDWRSTMEELADVSGGATLSEDALRERVDEAESATSELVSELRDLGAPDLEGGDELEEQLDDATAELESSFEDLREGAEEAADAPAGERASALADLATQFAAFQVAIAQTVDTLENADLGEESKAELRSAFANAPACQALQADS